MGHNLIYKPNDRIQLFLICSILTSIVLSSTAFIENASYAAAPGNAGISPPSKHVAELGDNWWKWGFAIDTSKQTNPFTEPGQDGCDIGLQKPLNVVFFVGSGVGEDGKLFEHNCSIPLGTSILFPIVNVACNTQDPPPFYGKNEQEQRDCAKGFIDKAFDLQVVIDGKTLKDPEQYRLDSPKGGFTFTAVENNPFSTPPGDGTGVSDGFWILLNPLPPGKHTISFTGKLDLRDIPGLGFIFQAGAIYNLDVKSKGNTDKIPSNTASANLKDFINRHISKLPSIGNNHNEGIIGLPNILGSFSIPK